MVVKVGKEGWMDLTMDGWIDGWMDLRILTRGIEGNVKIILRVKAAVGSWQESSAGGSAVGTGG